MRAHKVIEAIRTAISEHLCLVLGEDGERLDWHFDLRTPEIGPASFIDTGTTSWFVVPANVELYDSDSDTRQAVDANFTVCVNTLDDGTINAEVAQSDEQFI